MISDIRNPFFTALVRAVEDVAHESEYSIFLCNSDEDPQKEQRYVELLMAERVAGVIIVPSRTNCWSLLQSGRVPVVTVDRVVSNQNLDSVVLDNTRGAFSATTHLIGLGHRRIALIGLPSHVSVARERRQGYEQALHQHGIPLDETLIRVGDFAEPGGYRAARELLGLSPRPTAIFAANNLMAFGAMHALQDEGLAMPEDMSLVAFDDMSWYSLMDPPLTAVRQPTYCMGEEAARLLMRRLRQASGGQPEHIVLTPELIIRKPTAAPPPLPGMQPVCNRAHIVLKQSLESGCGKTTAGRTIIRLLNPTGGEIRFNDPKLGWLNLEKMTRSELLKVRPNMQIIFQDPFSSLNPRMTVERIIAEPLVINNVCRGQELKDRVADLLRLVGMRPEYMSRYPHAFSGGQRQRLGIARALALNPKLIICDEPVSALDVSIQAQVLNLLEDLQAQFNLTYLFIAHDLSVVEHITDRVAVMYVGKLVEMAKTDDLYYHPTHPYSEALMAAVPKPIPRRRDRPIRLPGEVASPANPPSGCYFHPRCRYAQEVCKKEAPQLAEIAQGHWVSCHLAAGLHLRGVLG